MFSLPILEKIPDNFSLFADTPYMVSASQTLTYSQIENYAELFRLKLSEYKLKQDRIIVFLPKNQFQISLILAIWANESIYIPIDINSPKDRIQSVVKDSEAALVINEKLLEQWLSDTPSPELKLKGEIRNLKPDNICYIIYTSGTTGTPKGVCISFKNLDSKLDEELDVLKVKDQVSTLLLTNFAFDVSILEFFLPLITGGKVTLPTDQNNSSSIVSDIIENGVTVLQGTPTFFNSFFSVLSKAEFGGLNKVLRIICIGGESLNRNLVNLFKENLPAVQLNNHYGPTETTIDAIVYSDVQSFDQNFLGYPLKNTSIHILDEHLNILDNNEVGEIAISGASVALGYWKREKLTNSNFINHPSIEGRLYLTGDLGKKTSDKKIVFIGRKDTQAKYLGYRIELEEISFHLKNIDEIISAHTELIENKLVTWVKASTPLTSAAIKEKLSEKLPFYMIPTSIIFVEDFPTTPNGKIDSKELIESYEKTLGFVSPKNDLQQQISTIWKELLQQDEISIKSNFFEIGGNSLRVMFLRNEIHRKFNVLMPVKYYYSYSTIEELDSIIKTIKWAKSLKTEYA